MRHPHSKYYSEANHLWVVLNSVDVLKAVWFSTARLQNGCSLGRIFSDVPWGEHRIAKQSSDQYCLDTAARSVFAHGDPQSHTDDKCEAIADDQEQRRYLRCQAQKDTKSAAKDNASCATI